MGERRERKEAHAETRRKAKENGLSSPLNDGLENPSPVWSMHRIGELTIRSKQRDPRRQPNSDFAYIDISAVSNTSFRITHAATLMGSEAPSRARKEIRHNDVLFATVRPTLKRIALVPKELDNQIASTGFIVLRPDLDRLDARYLYYRLLMDEFTKRMGELERGASYPAVRDCDVLNETIPVPPLATQREIAATLGQVQKAIEEQERLLALTEELKRTLLHRLFTQGLRGEPQKQTDIGPVPESWGVVPLDAVFNTQLGKMLSQKAHGGGDPKPYLRNKNVQWGAIDTSDLLDMDFNPRERKKFLLSPGDLLVCEGGEPGRAAIWHGELDECYYQKALHRLRPKDRQTTNQFLYHWLTFAFHVQNVYGVAGASSTIAHMPEAQLKTLIIPMPLRKEQDAICETLDGVDKRLAYHQRKHATLSDLFRTLLHQLMTGQVYVA